MRQGILPNKPSPLVVNGASKQLSIQRALLRTSRSNARGGPTRAAKITLHIPYRRSGHKRNTHTTVEPLRGSDASVDNAIIYHVSACSAPIRIKHGRRTTRVEEFLVRQEPETCTFSDAICQYRLGFDITLITTILSHNIIL
jgi:hypothetical protein